VQQENDHKNLVERGFTLIELLVVIAILGILAGVVVFAVGGIVDRGKNSACKTEVSTVQTAIEAFYAKNGIYPAGTGFGALNTAIGPASANNKFLNSALTGGPNGSPSIVAGYDYAGGGDFSGGTCPA
jgi:prepilin-type N-terminal cleavage/methylation domain-containing protein